MADVPLNVLLIDDDELDRLAVLRAFKRSPVACQITQAATASEGLALASQQHFDAILLDYRLPDQDGIEVLRLLRNGSFNNVAVLMLSRMEDESLAELCLNVGAQDFLLKDEVNGRRLARAVQQARQRFQIESALQASREQLLQLSEHDALTGLTNRRGFEQALGRAIIRAKRGDHNLAVLLLDLDDFKSVNDKFGHDAGDELLIEVARRLSDTIRESDLLCRLGGDEFVVLMTHFDQPEQAIYLADRLVAVLLPPVNLGSATHRVTTSIGIATLQSDDDKAADLLRFADMAMYQAKQEGRNQSRYFSSALQDLVKSRANLKNELQRALDQNEFELYYQAQVHASDRSMGGVEALIRWNHPQRGLLPPAEFIAAAEESGQIIDLGNWVLENACKQLGSWQTRFPSMSLNLTVGVNLSAIQIRHNTLHDAVKYALSFHGVPASKLHLELTESALISDAKAATTMLNAISELGVSISLDDFGTGYSSLEQLQLFPINTLKIDKSFVSAIGRNSKGELLLVALIRFAKTLGMTVVVEGVETTEQAEFCTLNGADLLQGYFISFPLPASEFEKAYLL